ncbi:uncharacterized protein LOC132194746 [Neocloeon triangulifer]|uniref:uncharacterized protein LOC132194746 n=1 Tax=Neocloeon triangulifer TaxID=2078957 RepID=UPI00286F84B5|nr:uncharacterized protein LOC132194746 [Neocloeon triangulifer]
MMRAGSAVLVVATILVQVAPMLTAELVNNVQKKEERIGGFGRGVGQLDVSLGLHPSLLKELPFYQQQDKISLSDDDRSTDLSTPQYVQNDQQEQRVDTNGSLKRNYETPAQQVQVLEEKGYDCTAILMERLNKRCCRLPVLVPRSMIDNCTIRDDVSPEYSKRFKVRRGPRCLYDCAFRELNLMSDDGTALDILQITASLENSSTSSWKRESIREWIIQCNDDIAKLVQTKILNSLSGENCSVLPWVMLKCMKKKLFNACPDAEIINRDNDCSKDMQRLQGCNPFTLTNTSQVKPASRPETPANDAFELLKPQTPAPNASSTTSPPLSTKLQDRRFDVRRTTPTRNQQSSEKEISSRRNKYGANSDQERDQDRDNFRSGQRNDISSRKVKIKDVIQRDEVENIGSKNGRMKSKPGSRRAQNSDIDESENREELIFSPSSTEAHEKVVKPRSPLKFHSL